jgi:hypothetical protein
MMAQDRAVVNEHNSVHVKLGGLIISAVRTMSGRAEVVVGRPGLPNIQKALTTGGAVLFETPDAGLFEVRLLAAYATQAEFLITQISPRQGIAGGLVEQDVSNAPFTPSELARIAESLRQIGGSLTARSDVTAEQMDLVLRKLDEMREASERLGRKDWMSYVLGTLTSLAISGTFDREVARALFTGRGRGSVLAL